MKLTGGTEKQETRQATQATELSSEPNRVGEFLAPPPYFEVYYDSKERFASYWHQINEVTALRLFPALEIGIGNGFVSNYLKKKGIDIVTIDIDAQLKPDKIGSVLCLPFPDGHFKVVICFEVLEHLPYDEFPKALSELYRVSSEYALVSLPDASPAHRIEIWIPKIGSFRRLVEVPWKKLRTHVFDGYHCWEIGKFGYPLKRIIADMVGAGFKVETTFRVYEYPYHRFFRLSKTG